MKGSQLRFHSVIRKKPRSAGNALAAVVAAVDVAAEAEVRSAPVSGTNNNRIIKLLRQAEDDDHKTGWLTLKLRDCLLQCLLVIENEAFNVAKLEHIHQHQSSTVDIVLAEDSLQYIEVVLT